jgi:2-C-methyl-D-erythritol 2,4-cyclodiphosphate synthase
LDFRVGIGYDAHPLIKGRPLILGGVTIDHPKGLLGHSDADALAHALCDAILGAAALGDMGKYFPNTDLKWKNANSLAMLKECARLAKDKGWAIGNMDSTIICQEPKLSGYIGSMIKKIAETLEISADKISIKAKTTEELGFEGRQEGISAQAVVLLQKK